MMVYADYAYYSGVYYGKAIQEADFPHLSLLASNYLDFYTQGRAEKNPCMDELRMACCALAEQYQAIEAAEQLAQKSLAYSVEHMGTEVSSETVGSWSKSYRSGGEGASSAAASLESSKAALPNIARQYLARTGLIYRGGRCCPCQCSPTL